MEEKIFGISLVPYFIIGIIYAFISNNRLYLEQKNKIEQDDKFTLWLLSCLAWPIFVISDILAHNTISTNKEIYNKKTIIFKEGHIPSKLINISLKQNDMPSAKTILKLPENYNDTTILEYIGDIEIIQKLTNKTKVFNKVVDFVDGFQSLSSVKHNRPAYDITVYLLWDCNKKVIGVFTIAGDITSKELDFDLDFYYGQSLPEVFSQI